MNPTKRYKELKTKLEYRIIAINKSGEGSPSNTVMVLL
jgi:hypothetical protein